jgi:5-hydroxyisourate hydrolase
MNSITTHVLDLTSGRPAVGLALTLSTRGVDGLWSEIARGVTDADGRISELLPVDQPLSPGDIALRFDSAAYFVARKLPTFYSEVVISFRVDATEAHYHVPLLLSPFGYSTYRGS